MMVPYSCSTQHNPQNIRPLDHQKIRCRILILWHDLCQLLIQVSADQQQNSIIFEMADNLQRLKAPSHSNQRAPAHEEIRYIQWGVQQAQQPDLPSKHAPFSQSDAHSQKRGPEEEGNNFQSEYSQVSAIETGFKKLKTNQIEILRELKKQYEVLRNSSLDSHVYLNKLSSESQSNADSLASRSEVPSSIPSKRRGDNKELRLVVLEKKQLQLMLANSMKKIEELLHSEIELKKQLLDLHTKIQANKSNESEQSLAVRRSKENEDSLQRSLEDCRRENESLKARVRQLVSNVGNLQGTVSVKEVQYKKKEERVKALEEEVQCERNKYASLQLDLKKLKMEYDLLEKAKNDQISLLHKNKSISEEYALSEKNQTINKLKEELQVKEERYLLLINKLSHWKPNENTEEKTFKVESQENNESIALILSKLQDLQQRPESQLQTEIHTLKRELELLKSGNSQKEVGQYENRSRQLQKQRRDLDQRNRELQRKVRDLQKTIEEQSVEKIYFMEDLKRLTKDYAAAKREKQELARENRQLRASTDRFEQDYHRCKAELDLIKNVNIDLTESTHQNKNLLAKLQHLNLKELQAANAREDAAKRVDELRAREQLGEEELRALRRQLQEEQLKVFKEHEENELRLRLLKRQHEAELAHLQQELDRAKKTAALEKIELINDKTQTEKKALEHHQKLQGNCEKLAALLKQRQEELGRARIQIEKAVEREHAKRTAEIVNLVGKVQALAAANQRLIQQSQRYLVMQQQALQLRRLVRANRKLTDTVDHLWQVKQAEYANLNELLKQLA